MQDLRCHPSQTCPLTKQIHSILSTGTSPICYSELAVAWLLPGRRLCWFCFNT